MRFSKKLTLLPPTLLCIVMLLVSACGGGGTTPGGTTGTPQPASADKQVFRYPMGPNDFTNVDPASVQYTIDAYALQTIFTGLVQLNDKGEVVDQMAASHQVSSDGLTYTFTLKPGLKFSNGDPLTSQDVVYSINRLIDPATNSPVSYYVALIKGFDDFSNKKVSTLIGSSLLAPDPQTVKIVISKPAAYFLSAMTYPATYPINKKLVDKYGGGIKWTDHMQEGAGDGPFMVQSYSHTIGMTLVPNPNYYGAKPRLQKLVFMQSGDANTTYKSYLSGQFDEAAVPATNLAQAKTRPDYHRYGNLVVWYIAMNYLYKPFDNIKIRQAFDLAINKDLLVSSVLRGAHKPTNHIVPEGMVGYNANLKGPDGTNSTAGNPAMAKQLFAAGLQEEGYASAAALPSITFLNRTNSPRLANIMTALIQQWQTVLGVTLKTQLYDNAKFNDQLLATTGHPGPAELWIAGWQADYPDPQDWLTTFFAKGADYNYQNYGQNNSTNAAAQQAVQAKLLEADVNSDPNARLAAYNDAEQQIVNDVGWLSLYQAQGHSLLNPKIVGYGFNNLNITAPDDWGSIYVAQ